MGLVDDDVAEVVGRVVRGQEIGIRFGGVHVERLVRGDQDPGVLLGIAARDGRRVRSEDVLEGSESLVAELVPIADEQRSAELTGVRDFLQECDCDERLAGPRRERKKRPLLAPRELLQDRADRGILVVAPLRLTSRIRREERPSGLGVEPESHALLVAGAETVRSRKG